MNFPKVLFILAVVILVAAYLVSTRYEIQAIQTQAYNAFTKTWYDRATVFRLDHWTGEVKYASKSQWITIESPDSVSKE